MNHTIREKLNLKSCLLASSGSLSVMLAFGLAGAAAAQTAGPSDLGEVVVTASRVQRAGFEAPTPTTVLGVEQIEQRSPTNIISILNEIPSFRPTQTPTTRTVFAGAGQSTADLRGLGNKRTLVLVDGRRFVPSTQVGVVDLNLIPTIMVDRIDVVTGGASAAYGSDALAGVTNFILNKTLDGVRLDVSYGQSKYHDAKQAKFGGMFGGSVSGGRGHFVIGGEYVDQGPAGSPYTRPYGRREVALATYPTTPARPAGQPSRLYAEHTRSVVLAGGGVIIGVNADTNAANGVDALRGIQFGPGGTVQPFTYGQQFGTLGIGGGNYMDSSPGSDSQISVALERYSVMGNFNYEISPSLNFFVEAAAARSAAQYLVPTRQDFNTGNNPEDFILIKRDNAFLPTQVASIMDANGISQFYMGRLGHDLGNTDGNAINRTERIAFGFDGSLFGDKWKWNAYYQLGRNIYDQPYYGVSIEANYQKAYDAVRNPAGQIVCRANLTTVTDSACVPLNLFGKGSPSKAAEDYIEGDMFFTSDYRQQVAAFGISGEPFSTWAGPVSVAAGGEYRSESIRAHSDEISIRNGFDYLNPQPFKGSYNVKEVFAETVIPLAKDMTFARLLEFNGAIRRTDYSTSGTVTTWKLGGTYEPVDGVRLRLTRSRDIRAPNLQDLFGVSTATTSVVNPFTRVSTGPIQGITGGNPALTPEIGNTLTAGIVVQPLQVPGLRMSVDYYDIKISNAIASYSAQVIADNCLNEQNGAGRGYFCNLLVLQGSQATPAITRITTVPFNINRQTLSGFDFEAAYSHALLGGNLGVRAYATYTQDNSNFDASGRTQNAGALLTGQPRWMGTVSTTYRYERFSGTLQTRILDSAKLNPTLIGPDDKNYSPSLTNSVNINRNPALVYWNLSAQYDVLRSDKRKLQFYAVIDNLFDKSPPFTGASVFYDVIGRYAKVGARYSF